MTKVFSDISMSLDGFIAGPSPTLEEPLGQGGEQLHEWVVKLQTWRKSHGKPGGETGPQNELFQATIDRTGAAIMGRKMFNGGSGPWKDDPNPDGWWGDNPPFHVPVFILTSHPREKVVKEGGTTFTFVTDGIKSALEQAKAAAGDKDVSVAGGANAIQQFISAGLLDKLEIHMVPVILGGGTKLLDNIDPQIFEKVRVLDHPEVTHLKFHPNK